MSILSQPTGSEISDIKSAMIRSSLETQVPIVRALTTATLRKEDVCQKHGRSNYLVSSNPQSRYTIYPDGLHDRVIGHSALRNVSVGLEDTLFVVIN